jgi:PIN domain nuclease of toxin-antitoxin system
MKLLLDTCTFLWIAGRPSAVSARARELCLAPDLEGDQRAVSAWEIVTKHGLDRLPLPEPPERLVPRLRDLHGIEPLPIDEESVLQISRLPALHRDPFDRLLVCQAIVHGMTLLTPDDLIARYPARVVW